MILQPSVTPTLEYMGSVSIPDGQYTSFFLEVRWAAAQGGFRFTTQASIVPMARPFSSCSGDLSVKYNCKRMV